MHAAPPSGGDGSAGRAGAGAVQVTRDLFAAVLEGAAESAYLADPHVADDGNVDDGDGWTPRV